MKHNPAIQQLMQDATKSEEYDALNFSKRDTAAIAAESLDKLFLRAVGEEWRSRYEAGLSNTKPINGGDPAAIVAYSHLIGEHVKKLNSLVATHSELLLPYSQKCLNWPVCVAKPKQFGEDADAIISELKIGKKTVANNPKSKFDPKKPFGKIALSILERIEQSRTEPSGWWYSSPYDAKEAWRISARALPQFPPKLPPNPHPNRILTKSERQELGKIREAQLKWLDVMEQVLESDFRDPEIAANYISMLTAPSYERNRSKKAAFLDKARRIFETFW